MSLRPGLISILVLACVVGCSTSSRKAARNHQQYSFTTPLEDAKQLYEEGQLDAADKMLRFILQADPRNKEASYYLALVEDSQIRRRWQQANPKPRGYYQTIPQQPIYGP